jgi:hypothetical protein
VAFASTNARSAARAPSGLPSPKLPNHSKWICSLLHRAPLPSSCFFINHRSIYALKLLKNLSIGSTIEGYLYFPIFFFDHSTHLTTHTLLFSPCPLLPSPQTSVLKTALSAQ